MNVYTASKFENHHAVRLFNQEVRKRGHRVTWDWTCTDEFDPVTNEIVSAPTAEKRAQYGYLDYAGVMAAELCVVLDGPWALNGARWEAGMTIGNGGKVWIVNYTNPVIFDVLPQVAIIRDEEAALSLLEHNVAVL